jgi:hypothetical protein
MRKVFVLAALMLVISNSAAFAQVSAESEVGTNRRDGEFGSQYVFYDWQSSNLLTRYFWVNDAVNRFELSYGPTLKAGDTIIKLQFGGTAHFTGEAHPQVMTATTIIGKIATHQVMYIGDVKWATRRSEDSDEFYQKLFVALDAKSVWQLRAESLTLGSEEIFLRLGFEYQYQLNAAHHFYAAPFYDPIAGTPGIQIGFRRIIP